MKLAASILLLIAITLFLPMQPGSATLEGLDPAQVRIGLAFFAFIASLWMTEALPLPITALLVPVLGTALGLTDVKASLAAFAAPPIYLFFGGFVLAAALSVQEIDRWIAGKLIRLGKSKFIPVSLWMFAGTALLSMWISNTATTAMMMPLALGVLRSCKKETITHSDAWFLLLGIAYSASIGGIGTIVGSPPNGIGAKQLGLTFSEWMRFGVPAVAVLLPAMVAALWLMLRPKNSTTAIVAMEEETGAFRFTIARTTTLVIFAMTALGWVFSVKLGSHFGIVEIDTWIAIAAVILLAATKVVTWKDIESGTDWGVLLLFGGGLALSAILGSSGASLFMARLLGGAMKTWPIWAVIGVVVCFVIFLTELSSNTASAALFVPVFFTMSTEFGLSPPMLILPLGIAASCAFMLPVGTPPNAIVFGTGLIPQRQMIHAGLVLNILFILLITVLSLLLF